MTKNTRMASSLFTSFFFTIVVILSITTNHAPFAAASKEFKVGGGVGWRLPPSNETDFYNHWASTKRFHIGDSLRFEYNNKNDSVLVVDKWGFYHCNSTHPYSKFNNGNTIVKLDKSGPIYFTTGDPNHCKQGQRLQVDVMMDAHNTPINPPPPPSIHAPPTPTPAIPTPTPTPSPTANSVPTVAPLKLFSQLLLLSLLLLFDCICFP
ncbi:hypothetical protein LguiA_028695 [Lonicera macranthoides]